MFLYHKSGNNFVFKIENIFIYFICIIIVKRIKFGILLILSKAIIFHYFKILNNNTQSYPKTEKRTQLSQPISYQIYEMNPTVFYI